MKKKPIRKGKGVAINTWDIGRAVTVLYDDIGRRDGILVQAIPDSSVAVFEFGKGLTYPDREQIIDMRDFVPAF